MTGIAGQDGSLLRVVLEKAILLNRFAKVTPPTLRAAEFQLRICLS